MKFEIIYSSRKSVAIQVKGDGSVIVRSPFGVKKSVLEKLVEDRSEWINNAVKKQVERAANSRTYTDADIERLRALAKEILPVKVEYFSKIMGVKPTALHISSAKKRFGSCSAKNSINFSLYLMDYDERAIDYVVVHELAHIKHHDHSRAFYAFVASVLPDYKEREALLKK